MGFAETTREEKIERCNQLLDKSQELGKQANEVYEELIKEVSGRNECTHLGWEMSSLEYANYSEPVCKIDARGHKSTGDFYNRIDVHDCATCPSYERNPNVEKSVFTGVVYKKSSRFSEKSPGSLA